MSYCPECEAAIDEDFEEVGEVISCPECGVELEVISIDPVEFDLALESDEDEEDDDYRFDDTDEDEDDWDEEDDSYDEEDDDEKDDY